MAFLLKSHFRFPHPKDADPDGLLAIGGDLHPQRLLIAYRQGIFPWFRAGEAIQWYSPHERCVLFPDKIKVSKSMTSLFRKKAFEVRQDQAFPQVIRHCAYAARKGQTGTWITGAMQNAYIALYQMGYAHSTECWEKGTLAGGLYGVAVHNIFCGESMFSLRPNASKYALISLCRQGRYKIIDCQVPSEHLWSLGAEMISGDAFREFLKQEEGA